MEDATLLVRNSSLYKEFLAERAEILRHKWIESEKAGFDIGFDRALMDWIVRYDLLGISSAKWTRGRLLWFNCREVLVYETSPDWLDQKLADSPRRIYGDQLEDDILKSAR